MVVVGVWIGVCRSSIWVMESFSRRDLFEGRACAHVLYWIVCSDEAYSLIPLPRPTSSPLPVWSLSSSYVAFGMLSDWLANACRSESPHRKKKRKRKEEQQPAQDTDRVNSWVSPDRIDRISCITSRWFLGSPDVTCQGRIGSYHSMGQSDGSH